MKARIEDLGKGYKKIIRDDGAVFFKRPSGEIFDSKGKRLDVPGGGITTTFTPTRPGMPAEDWIPPVAAGVGALVGGAATLPTGAGVPFGATVGATAFGTAGQSARNIIRAMRGKPVPATPLESVGESVGTGITAGALELGGAGVMKGLTLPFVRSSAKQGISNLSEEIAEKYGAARTPTGIGMRIKGSLNKVIEKKRKISEGLYNDLEKVAGDTKASRMSDTLEFIENVFKKRDITYNPSKEALRQKLLQEADLSSAETAKIATQLIEEKSGKLVSALKSTNIKEYGKMADVLDDLSNSDLTYGGLKKVRTTIGDYANFDNPNPTGIEKVFRGVYHNLGKDMERTATEGGFGKLANEASSFYRRFSEFQESSIARKIKVNNPEDLIDNIASSPTDSKIIMKEFDEKGKNYIRRGLFDKIIDNGMIENPKGTGKILDINKLRVAFNKFKGAEGTQTIKEIYGGSADSVLTLRDLVNVENEPLKKSVIGELSRISISRPFTAIDTFKSWMSKANLPSAIQKVVDRNVKVGKAQEVGRMVLPVLKKTTEIVTPIRQVGVQGLQLPILSQ